MATRSALVGRQAECARLGEALERARAGDGSLVLVAGEAGVGKTRLAGGGRRRARGRGSLWGRAGHGAAAPYGPIVAALRSYLRATPDGLDRLRPAAAAPGADPARARASRRRPATGPPLFEAVRCAFAQVGRRAAAARRARRPPVVRRGHARAASGARRAARPSSPSLVIAAYRSDGLPRDHMLRRLRHELRRGGRLDELDARRRSTPAETAELLERDPRGARPRRRSTRAIHDRTQGVPFFVEELARALAADQLADRRASRARARAGRRGAAAGHGPRRGADRRLRALARGARGGRGRGGRRRGVRPRARRAGSRAQAGLAELVERDLIVEAGAGRARSGTRSPARRSTPTCRGCERRALHRRLAEALEAEGAQEHRAGDPLARRPRGAPARARRCCARPRSRAPCTPTATPPARGARRSSCGRKASEEERRIAALESYASSAELAGELAEAARAWREICAIRAQDGRSRRATPRPSAGWRRSTTCRGDRDVALAARGAAAEAYAAAGRPAEAAVERLAMANYLRGSAELLRGDRAGARRRAGTPSGPSGSTCARARSASRASPAPSAATSSGGLEIVRRGSRWRSSTT